jgi:hypothetical protein
MLGTIRGCWLVVDANKVVASSIDSPRGNKSSRRPLTSGVLGGGGAPFLAAASRMAVAAIASGGDHSAEADLRDRISQILSKANGGHGDDTITILPSSSSSSLSSTVSSSLSTSSLLSSTTTSSTATTVGRVGRPGLPSDGTTRISPAKQHDSKRPADERVHHPGNNTSSYDVINPNTNE